MVQPNLNPDYALSSDLKDLKDRVSRQEQVDLNVAGLHDVAVTLPVSGQALLWSSSTQRWINSNVSATSVAGVLPVANGGTGLASYAVGDILSATGSATIASLPDVATGNALISGGVGVIPSYGKVGLTTHVVGTLPVGSGGTGLVTATGYLKGTGTTALSLVTAIPIADGGTGVATGAGLVPMIPTSVTGTGGTPTFSTTTGQITVPAGTSAFAINTIFTSAYRNYRVMIDWGAGTAADNLFMTPRNGTTNAGSILYYGATAILVPGGTTSVSASSSQVNFWHIGGYSNTTTPRYSHFSGDIFSPLDATSYTGMNGQAFSIVGGNWESRTINGNATSAAAHDGLYFWSQSGSTFAAILTIYGYKG